MVAEEPTPPPLEALLAVQDLDTEISQLQHRRAALEERRALADLDATTARLAARAAEVQDARDDLSRRQTELEALIAQEASRRESIEQRLYGARNAAPRDLQAMDDEVKHLRQRRASMEDEELELMVASEPLDAELAELGAQRERLDAEAAALRAAVGTAEVAIDGELASRTAARRAAAATVPAELLERYEALRTRLGGTGAARLVGSRCSGCHLELPSMEVDRIRRLPPGTVVTCEQCGRILVPVPAPGR